MMHTPAHKNVSAPACQFDASSCCGMPAPKVGDQYPSIGDGLLSPIVMIDDTGLPMTAADCHRVAQRWERRGGGFFVALAKAYYLADSHNQRKLHEAFKADFFSAHDLRLEALSNDGSSTRRAEDGYCGS